jgi:hypothetical protein
LYSFAARTNTGNWKSDNQSNYLSRTSVDPAALAYPAGRASKDFGHEITTTDLITRSTEANKLEPANLKGDLVRQPPVTKHRVSEHNGKFQWPATNQRDVYAPSATMRELGLDRKKYQAVGDAPKVLGSSAELDYERRLAELRHKQKGIVPVDAPVAGRPSKPESEDVTETFHYPFDLGTSEYKTKFKEWPIGEHPIDHHSAASTQNVNTAAPSSRVFSSSGGNSYAELRQHSLYHDSYPAYSLNVMSTTAPKVDGRANESNKPPAFAWSLVDGEKPAILPEHHDPAVSQMGESEYTRKYHWPAAETLASMQQHSNTGRSQDNQDSIATILFPSDAASQGAGPVLSEYRQQFYDRDIFGNARAPASPNRDSQAPKQFAWALERGSNLHLDDDDEDYVKKDHPRPVTSDLSEHTNKYKWPMGTEPLHLVRKPDENHELKVGKVYALDDERDSRNWASEYDEKFAKLRQRQKELATTVSANDHVTGMPSASHPSIPSNFAWKESDVDKLPSAPVRSPKHVSPEHFHTEYEDKFLAWKNAQAVTPTKRTDVDAAKSSSSRLNLFETEPHAQYLAGSKSEYDDRFRFLVPGSGDSTRPFAYAKSKPDSDTLPQFAWPLADESLLRPAPVPAKPSKPLEKSEYKSKFLWPTGSNAAKSCKPQQDSESFISAPLAMEDDATSAGWKSEAQDPNHPVKADKNKSNEPAGLVHVRDKNVPSYFAWADTEEQKVPSMPPRPVEQPLEVVNSEARSEYRGHSPATAPPAKICRPASTKDVPIHSEEEDKSEGIVSEYQANFSSSQDTKSEAKPIVAGISTSKVMYRPPQFAWPRVDPRVTNSVDNTKTAEDKERKFSDSTEYESKFIWPAAPATSSQSRPGSASANSRGSSKARSSVDHFEGNVTLLPNPGQVKTSDWCSEYDARCAETQQKQPSASRAASAPPAMRNAARTDQTPPFFAWSADDVAAVLPPPAPLPKSAQEYHTETSENRDRFIPGQDFVCKDGTSNLRGTRRARPAQKDQVANLLCDPLTETSCSVNTEMKTEYEAQYTQEHSHEMDQDHKIVHRDILQATLPGTNLDKYTPHLPLPSPPANVRKSNPNAAMQYRTEYSDHFTWQEQSPGQPESVSTASNSPSKKKKTPTQKMKSQSVAVKQSIPHRSDANKESVGSTLFSVASPTAAGGSGTTEYRRQFSWPEAARKPNDLEVEREGVEHSKAICSETQRRQKLAEQKKRYQLLSKNDIMLTGSRGNNFRTQSYKDGKDHTSVRSATFGRAERFPDKTAKLSHADESGFTPYHSTLMSQDSLNPPATQSKSPSTASTATSTGTVVTESECASLNQPSPSTSSSSSGRPAASKVMPPSPSSPPLPAINGQVKEPTSIPGLREYDPKYRARSASPRHVVGSSYADSTAIRTGLYTDQTPSNPVLMNRRYPLVSDRQRTRWSTETRDSFAWTPRHRVGRGVRSSD